MPRTIVLTGGSDGIGAAAARMLAADGHHIVLVGRSRRKTETIAREIGASDYFLADFSHLAEVRGLAETLTSQLDRIDVLANNAGGMFNGPMYTRDGFEENFQVNYLAPFLLTRLLLDPLITSGGSIINTSSASASMFGHLDLDDLNSSRRFTPTRAYGTAKLAQILFTQTLHERYSDRGVSSVAFHPGVIASNFGERAGGIIHWAYHSFVHAIFSSVEKGGANLAHFIGGQPGEDWESGRFYGSTRKLARLPRQARNEELAEKLWVRSVALVGLPA